MAKNKRTPITNIGRDNIMSKQKPNWDEIKRCGIWKVSGVIECNNCSGLIECWGTDTQLEINNNAIKELEKVLDDNVRIRT